jgi:hypothetical protein
MKLKSWSFATVTLLIATAFVQAPAQSQPAPAAPARSGPTTESLERKARSLAQLKNEEVPTTPDWPPLPDSTRVKLRTTQEVAHRAVAVCFTALKAEGANQDTIEGLVRRYKARKFFTPAEWEFVDNNAPTNDDRNRYLWRYEDLAVLMWALGYSEELSRPDRACDVRRTVSHLSNRTLEQFLADAKLRDIQELLDAADLTYRYNAAIDDAKRRGKPAPAGLDRQVVRQRHQILSWLIGQP